MKKHTKFDEVLKFLGLTRTDLACLCGVRLESINRVFDYGYCPSLGLAMRIMYVLELDVDELLVGEFEKDYLDWVHDNREYVNSLYDKAYANAPASVYSHYYLDEEGDNDGI